MQVSALIPAALMASFLVVGASFAKCDGFGSAFGSLSAAIGSIARLIGFTALLYIALLLLYRLLDAIRSRPEIAARGPLLAALSGERGALAPFLVILGGWLPYLIAFYPGSLEWDFFLQLDECLGIYLFSNWQPVFSTLLINGFVRYGHTLGSDNLGAFLYILFQSALLGAGFAFVVRFGARVGAPLWLRLLSLAWYTVLPVWGMMAQFGVKDVLYTSAIVCFTLTVWRYIVDERARANWGWRFLTIGVSLLVSLLRNNGIYLTVMTVLLLAFADLRRWRAMIGVAASVFVLYLFWLNVCLPALGASPGMVKEALSLPFQQTARSVKEHEDEISEAEWETIRTSFAVENPGQVYMPYRADSVKNLYRSDADTIRYLLCWARMGLQYPDSYLAAFCSLTYGYWYPFAKPQELPLCRFNTEIEQNLLVNTGAYAFQQSEWLAQMRQLLKKWYNTVDALPVLSALQSLGAYTWLLIALLGYLFRIRRADAIAGFLPAALSVAMCCLSPVNGMLRYFLPVMAVTPLMLFGIRALKNRGDTAIPCRSHILEERDGSI